jgi:cyclohexadienyl dehydratase
MAARGSNWAQALPMKGRSFVFAFAIAFFALPVAAQQPPPDR